MSMLCEFSSVSDATFDFLSKNQMAVMRLFFSEQDCEEIVAHQNQIKQGFFSKLFGKKSQPKIELPEFTPSENEGLKCDIGKSWHAIHFLMTGSGCEGDPPLNFILLGGYELEGTDAGYGPYRLFTSEQVKQIGIQLQKISKDEFVSRYDSDKMRQEDIYPAIWGTSNEEGAPEFITENFLSLKKYIHELMQKDVGFAIKLY